MDFSRACLNDPVASMLRTRSSRASRGELMSVVQRSHVKPGAGCSVDVGSGSAGRGGSAEAESVNADVDDGPASTLALPEASWKIATSIGTKVRLNRPELC